MRLLLPAFLPLLLAPARLHAEWVQTQGPESGHVTALAADGSILLAGMDGGGVYLSRDNGATWKPANRGIECANIRALAIHGKLFFAGASGDRNGCSQGIGGVGGVFLSSDNGASWIRVDSGWVDPSITDLAVHGGGLFTRTRIFAATRSGGVIRSADNGKTWQAVNEGLPTMDVRRPHYANINDVYASGGALYAATSVGLYHSTDHGESWTPRQKGFPVFRESYPKYLSINGLVERGSTLIAATQGYGLFRSDNRGGSWTQMQYDKGYEEKNDPLLFVHSLAASGRHLYAGTSYGVYHSSDGGRFWVPLESEPAKIAIACLAASGSRVFAGTQGLGVLRISNRESEWSHINKGLANSSIVALAAGGPYLFAAAGTGGIFRSSDDGNSWTPVKLGFENGDNSITGLFNTGNSLFVQTYKRMVFRSRDQGREWTPLVIEKRPATHVMSAGDTADVFAFTSLGLYRSTDHGETWTHNELKTAEPLYSCLTALGSILFVGVKDSEFEFAGNVFQDGGIYSSRDSGASWARVSNRNAFSMVEALAVSGASLFAGTPEGLFHSSDSGSTWTRMKEQPGRNPVDFLAVFGRYVFAGTQLGYRAYHSPDGSSWKLVEEDRTLPRIGPLAVKGAYLFAGTHRRGVWRRPLPEIR